VMVSDSTVARPGTGLVGNFENRWTRLSGSCMSCRAREKVGYLYVSVRLTPGSPYVPLLDEMVQSSNRLSILQVLCQSPFSPSNSPGEFLGESLVFSEFSK